MKTPRIIEEHVVHQESVFGRWCYICRRKRHWWAFWMVWAPRDEDHDEPF